MPPKTPEEAIYAKLKSLSALTDVVGERITPQLGTQEPVYPFVTYQRDGADATSALSQSSGRPVRYLMRVTIYARNEEDLGKAGTAIVEGLHHWSDGANGVQGCFHSDSAAEQGDGEVRALSHIFALFFRKPS